MIVKILTSLKRVGLIDMMFDAREIKVDPAPVDVKDMIIGLPSLS